MNENPKEISEDKQKAIDTFLEKLPPEVEIEVTLPSKCNFYRLLEPGKPVTVRPMTFEDEKAVASSRRGNVDIINILLSRCVSNINIGELISMDKMFLLLKLREISYGAEYKAVVTCPECEAQGEVTMNLAMLKINEVPDDLKDPREIHLPVLDKTCFVRFPRIKDEDYLKTIELTASQLWRFVTGIKIGKKVITDSQVIGEVVKKLPLKDVHAVINAMNLDEYGIDPRFKYDCAECAKQSVMSIPIGSDFFSMR